MTRPRFKRPADPMEIMERKRQQREDAEYFEKLAKNPDIRVAHDPGGRVIAAERQDIFARMLRGKSGSITQEQLNAVRRLEADMAASEGVDGFGRTLERVDCETAKGALDRKIEAHDRMMEVAALVGGNHWGVLFGILAPQFTGQLVDWRAVVAKRTGETDPMVQGYVLRFACSSLVGAYVEIDNTPREKRTSRLAQGA